MRILYVLMLAVSALLSCRADASAEQRVALVMGNSAYQHVPRLSNAVNDATILANTFRKAGFAVVEARNDLTATDMRRTLRDFAVKARTADIAVIYYAGHGMEVDGTNYLVPTDAQLDSDSDIYDETVALDRVLVAIEPARQLRLVILDSCRDNPFSKTMKRTLASRAVGGGGLAKVEPTSPNTMVAFAAKAGFTALDGVGNNSPFATALANHLATPGLDLRKAFGYVRDEVLKATGNRQEPFIYGSLGGDDVMLAPAAAAPPMVAVPAGPAAPDASATVVRDYEFAERVGTPEAWDLYIKAHPEGFYTELAKAQRNKLAAGNGHAVAKSEDRPQPKPADEKKPPVSVLTPPAARQDTAKPELAPKLASAGPATTLLPPEPEKKSVAAIPAASCTMRVAKANDATALGGPFVPVSIRPDIAGSEIRAIAVSPTGREVASAGDDGLIRIWDAGSFKLLRVLRGHSAAVYSLDFWKDGSLLASAGWDGKVKVWDVANGAESFSFDAGVKQYAVAFSPELPLRYLASAGVDGTIRIWDWQKKQLARSKLDHTSFDADKATVRSLSFAPDASGEFVSAGFDGKVRFFRTTGGAIDVRDGYSRKALRVAYSPDGKQVLSAGSGTDAGGIKIWDARTGAWLRSLVGPKDYVVSAAWSADGKRIVTGGGGRDKSVNLWDAPTGRLLASFAGHQEDVEAVAFYPGGNRIISAGEDKTIRVWDIAEHRQLFTAIGFGDQGFLAYTPEGCYAGSNGVEARLSIYNGSRFEPMSMEARKVMYEPAGFAALLAR